MAFNISTFKTRSLTAIIFVMVMLAGLLINQWTFFALFSIVHFGCWIEYQQLMGKINDEYKNSSPIQQYGVMMLGWMGMVGIFAFRLSGTSPIAGFTLNMVQWIALFLFAVLITNLIFCKKTHSGILAKYSIGGLLYISFSCAIMMLLFFFFQEKKWIVPILLISSIWINDTMAYLVGSFIGKTPLSKISPKKTWEGTIGGIVLSVGIMMYISYHFHALIFGVMFHCGAFLIITITGTLGDLLESKIKRLAGVKDSGGFMPGHGGFLDRFDSLLIATSCVWIYMTIYFAIVFS